MIIVFCPRLSRNEASVAQRQNNFLQLRRLGTSGVAGTVLDDASGDSPAKLLHALEGVAVAKKFEKFPKFPAEIRQMIFVLALPRATMDKAYDMEPDTRAISITGKQHLSHVQVKMDEDSMFAQASGGLGAHPLGSRGQDKALFGVCRESQAIYCRFLPYIIPVWSYRSNDSMINMLINSSQHLTVTSFDALPTRNVPLRVVDCRAHDASRKPSFYNLRLGRDDIIHIDLAASHFRAPSFSSWIRLKHQEWTSGIENLSMPMEMVLSQEWASILSTFRTLKRIESSSRSGNSRSFNFKKDEFEALRQNLKFKFGVDLIWIEESMHL